MSETIAHVRNAMLDDELRWILDAAGMSLREAQDELMSAAARRAIAAIGDPAEAILAERERCAEIAALFIHNVLYKPRFPACSYHSRDIAAAIRNSPQEPKP